ncbi:putative nucleic acid-binding protein [Kineosphaera limosa]|uniref:PIN domain-containing protein n=1 Tax=Kineosphaera limosa NBRC 100340 TaxID=1184609 RepID=K6X0S9_9MICO|nr:hypothetical protein [Kineosphaera limosa]NYD99071.1 putative nucleic acid-binding protein [Kineosphaera limosa]GAB97972.1 hypothetical protein KILIM_092_00050 [Kineosphaera limosa NBRC 100340]
MRELMHAIGAYDTGYVALAATRSLTLVTADARLARGAKPWCEVEAPPSPGAGVDAPTQTQTT